MKNKPFIVLLGSGRSGTTLIQRILNTYEDIMIWGEHQGALSQIADSYFCLKESKSMNSYSYPLHQKLNALSTDEFKKPEVWQAWINWFKKEDLKPIFNNLINDLFCPNDLSSKICGFKEIRYAESPNVIRFLEEVVPNLQLIVIVRDPLNNIESQFNTFANGTGRYPKLKRIISSRFIFRTAVRWRTQNQNILKLKKTSSNISVFRYEDIIENPNILNNFLEKFGKQLEEKQINVFDMKVGRGSAYKNSSVNSRWKNLGILGKIIVLSCTFSIRQELDYPSVTKLSKVYLIIEYVLAKLGTISK